ncbi:VWA domain-containing protein [Candidatus Bathyarchaeota archaeon]|nr:VWA domain-containing protein [Candidatus Bathyarchaeota archaeon]
MQRKRLVFPFSAVVDLDKLKLAILINAINPKIGGLLIRGPKGSGKTTIVRALTDILPKIKVVKDCPFNCSPIDPSNMCPICSTRYNKGEKLPVEEKEMVVVDLPLGATEDRVVGSLDVEKAIKYGIEALEPGILADANQNILYVDEVNLLPDHIADDLLDAAATGWNIVEREGISVSHPSRFIFIGTMNPEEGELRPQLLDRFPLSVNVERIDSVQHRTDVVKRNMEFETDPEKFYEKYAPLQEELRNRIAKAKALLKDVVVSEDFLEMISKTCIDLKVDGLRPDIVIAKAASALAAFEDRTQVTLDDVLVAADLALSHRTREGGFLEPATPEEIKEVIITTAKKLFQFEKTGETTKKKAEKGGILKGRAAFWVKKDATEKEEELAKKMGEKQSRLKKIQKLTLQLYFLLSRFTGGVWGIAKRLKKSPKNAPVFDAVQLGSSKLRGEIYEEKAEMKKGKGYPTVSDVAQLSDISKGYPFLTSYEKKVVSPSKFFLKMGKIKASKQTVYAGKRAQAVTTLHRGKPYGWKIPHGKPVDIYIPATIREAAKKQKHRKKSPETALKIDLEDVREKLRLYKASLTMIFVVDLSGSMLLNLEAIKEALLKLHSDAYRFRDRVGIVALKGMGAVVVQHPITNLRVVANKLVNLRISGYTPLATGMLKAWEVLKEAKRRDSSTIPTMVIITDGGANVPLKRSLETGVVRQIEEPRVIVREYEDLAVKDVMAVSKIIKREGIQTIIVNTNPHLYGHETYGFAVTQIIAAITSGSHHTVGRVASKTEMVRDMIEWIKEEQSKIVSNSEFA